MSVWFLQDLLHKIPVKKVQINPKLDKRLRYLKYVALLLLVILLPVLVRNDFDMGET